MPPTTNAPKWTASSVALSFAALLFLTACGGGADADAKESSAKESTKPAVDSFAVGEPFGKAVWSVDVGKAEKTTVSVMPDRVFVDRTNLDTRTIQAYTSEGEEAWTHELSDREYPENIEIGVLEKTVAVLEKGESEESGLDKAKSVTKLTLLSQEDGSVVTETEIPDGSVSINSYGSIVFRSDNGPSLVTEKGKILEAKDPKTRTSDTGLVNDIPFWTDRSQHVNTPSWSTREVLDIDDYIGADILAVDKKQGILVLQVFSGPHHDVTTYYGVEAETGKVAYELECPGYSHTDSESNVAVNSPNGKYGTKESIWLSASAGQCFGGGDGQKKVELTAIDDNGTAYGFVGRSDTAADELVAIPADGEPKVSKRPDGAPVPDGIVNGDLAIHLQGSTLTGNPIK